MDAITVASSARARRGPRLIANAIGVLAALAGCGNNNESSGDQNDAITLLDQAVESADPIEAQTDVTLGSGPTYYQDVAPILHRKCATCHFADGIGPYALTSADEASASSYPIDVQTASKAMPPWPPGPLSPPFAHQRTLADAELATIAAWAEAGAPIGDPKTAAPLPPPDIVDVGTIGLSTDIGVDYAPDASLDDDYRCFLVDLAQSEDHLATGYRIIPGNGRIVHHAVTTIYDASSIASLKSLDAATPDGAGWPCAGESVPESTTGVNAISSFGAWTPGIAGVKFPDGTGTFIPKGSVAVMQIHYNLRGGTDADRTKLEIAFAPSGTEGSYQRSSTVSLMNRSLSIPAEVKDVTAEHTDSTLNWLGGTFYADGDGYLTMVAGRMHMLGTHITIEVKNTSGIRTLLDIPDWKFHWQGSYQLLTPIKILKSDELTLRCIFNNTADRRSAVGYTGPVHTIARGDGLQDEVCIGYLTMVDNLP